MLETAIKSSMEMSREQCRAARALLRMSQEKLAKISGVSTATIMNFENSTRRNVSAEIIQALRICLEIDGAMFSDDGGVKLRTGRRK